MFLLWKKATLSKRSFQVTSRNLDFELSKRGNVNQPADARELSREGWQILHWVGKKSNPEEKWKKKTREKKKKSKSHTTSGPRKTEMTSTGYCPLWSYLARVSALTSGHNLLPRFLWELGKWGGRIKRNKGELPTTNQSRGEARTRKSRRRGC